MDVQPIVDWLIAGVPGAPRSPDVMQQICDRLLALGLPLARAECFVRTLHPHVVGRSFVWTPGNPVEIREQTWSFLQSPEFAGSPTATVFATGLPAHRPGAEGFADFLAEPLTFLTGQVHAITFATHRVGGFTAEELAAIRRVVPALSRIAEILALARTATNLLDTYVGRNAGERILAGRIQRGDVEPIRAVVWCSDLRGFTSLAAEVAPGELILALNDLFECQVPAIEARGGEVLKFIGDGLLAIFPIREGGRPVGALCRDALDAANASMAALEVVNARRSRPLKFGVALHIGEIVYGNIGGAGRLDFTCIGTAVNLAARLEGLTAELGRPVIFSEAFADALGPPTELLGAFSLKHVPGLTRAFAAGTAG